MPAVTCIADSQISCCFLMQSLDVMLCLRGDCPQFATFISIDLAVTADLRTCKYGMGAADENDRFYIEIGRHVEE